jgi:anti-sigma-K factor RskA
MNTPGGPAQPDSPDFADIAAEYVLGVLDARARRAAQERLPRDAAFAREVAEWEARLTPLIDDIVPVPVPYALWPRIRAAAGIGPAIDSASPADPRTRPRPGLWHSAPFWRWLSAGSRAVAWVAKMVQDDGKALFLATVDLRQGTLVVQPTTVEIPQGRVPELWLIPPGDRPHSLGLLDPNRANAIVVPKELLAAFGPRAVVAVTVEPPGGGPGGKPSGPIIAKGEISLL